MSPARDHEYSADGIAEESHQRAVLRAWPARGLAHVGVPVQGPFRRRAGDRQPSRGCGARRERAQAGRSRADHGPAGECHRWLPPLVRELTTASSRTCRHPSDIAQRLVRALRGALTPSENALLERGGTRNAEAYDLLPAGTAVPARSTAMRGHGGIPLFRSAVDHDPQFAQAHAGLGERACDQGYGARHDRRRDCRGARCERACGGARSPTFPRRTSRAPACFRCRGATRRRRRASKEAIRLNPSASHDLSPLRPARLWRGRDGEGRRAVPHRESRLEPDDYQSLRC